MERRIGHGWCLTVAIACALGACASKGSVNGSDDEKTSASSQKKSTTKQQRAPKDAGATQDADVDAAMLGSAGAADAFVPALDEPPSKYDCTYADDAKKRHGYWFCAAKTMREEARRLCADLGGDFLIIEDAEENAWIAGQIADDTYIGYSDALEEDDWIWVDGSKASYTNWDKMEPTEADYAFIEKASGLWKSTVATARAFACEGPRLFKD